VSDGTANNHGAGDPRTTHDLNRGTRLLKAVVVGLACVLALCGIIITVAIVYRVVNPALPPAPAGFGISPLPLPPGCTVDYVQAEGDRLILQIGGNDSCRRVLVTDLRSGALIGQFQFPNE
jgi:hypothetical protein